MVHTIRIAGAGISGLAAAIRLAATGREVEVLEVRSSFGSPAGSHTEGLRNYGSVDALEELRRYGFDLHPFAVAQVTVRKSPSHQNILTGPAYYLFARGPEAGSLDRMLVELARRTGVRLRFGVSGDSDDVDIVASGPPPSQLRLLGVGFAFSREGSQLDHGTLYALLDNDFAPGGYLAIASGPTAHSLYSVSWRDLNPANLKRRIEAAIRLPWIREILGTSRRVGEIQGGACFTRDPIEGAIDASGALRVGEAGGFQDAIAGYGIRYAIITGALAAQSILEGRDYRALLRETFQREFEEAFAFRERLNAATNDDFERLVQSMGPKMTLAEYRKHRGLRVL